MNEFDYVSAVRNLDYFSGSVDEYSAKSGIEHEIIPVREIMTELKINATRVRNLRGVDPSRVVIVGYHKPMFSYPIIVDRATPSNPGEHVEFRDWLFNEGIVALVEMRETRGYRVGVPVRRVRGGELGRE